MDIIQEDKLEKEIDALMQRLHDERSRQWRPMFPWVLVRVCKKSQTTDSGIFLPGHIQNKTHHEGIVLSTWKPIQVAKRDKMKLIIGGGHNRRHPVKMNTPDGEFYSSYLKPGDHVLFQHFAGLPVSGMSDDRYRIVKEEEWSAAQEGGIYATIEYKEKTLRPVEKLKEVLTHPSLNFIEMGIHQPSDSEEMTKVIKAIEHQFILVDRDVESVTISGR